MKNTPDAIGRTASIIEADVINSASPLETTLAGIHPRMLMTAESLPLLKSRASEAPWQGWLEALRQQADKMLEQELPSPLMGTPHHVLDIRHLGEQMIHLALLYRVSGNAAYRDRTFFLMDRLSAEADWGHSLIYGHWARGFGFALDWLWDDIDEDQRQTFVETLYDRSKSVFDLWASYQSGEPFGYTWNISAVVLGGLMASAACLYGERPGIAPMANMAWEKMRCQSAALGPDGVSPEGVMYGGYYTAYLSISFLLAESMFGIDLFETTPWLRQYSKALHAQTIPRDFWKTDDMFFNQGDAHGNVFGHEGVLRVLASRLKDGTALWFADEIIRSGKMGTSPFSFLLHDPSTVPEEPVYDPPLSFMDDFGIAVMRENRSGTGSSAAFKCAPNVGHHAARRFRHPLGGGHMHPNNGDLQIFSHGEWILKSPGYVYKDTAYHNTILINGSGQFGDKSEWLEDLPYRLRGRYPFMEKVEHGRSGDYCIADMTAAYPEETGLISVRRHVVYWRPDTWIIADAIESREPVLPEALFHTGFPVTLSDQNLFSGNGASAGCRLRFLSSAALSFSTELQDRLHSSGHVEGTMPLLRVSPCRADVRHLLVTEIITFPVHQGIPGDSASVLPSTDGETLKIKCGGQIMTIKPFERPESVR